MCSKNKGATVVPKPDAKSNAKRDPKKATKATPKTVQFSYEKWNCVACTYLNQSYVGACVMCNGVKRVPATKHVRLRSNKEKSSKMHKTVPVKRKANSVKQQQTDEHRCVVCTYQEATIVFLPCRHQHVCMTCSEKLSTCPVCRVVISDKFEPFR